MTFMQQCSSTPVDVLKKTKHICICQNFVKFPPNLMIFGRKVVNRLK